MANEVVKINGVTKREDSGKGIFRYYFPIAYIEVDTNQDTYTVKANQTAVTEITQSFADITDPLGATDAEEYVDTLAANGLYSDLPGTFGGNSLENRIIVNQDNKDVTLGGTIDPTKEYFIDGSVDMGTTQVTVPAGGISLKGYDMTLSKLTSSENGYTMFVSAGGGSGRFIVEELDFSVTGTGSQVFDLEGATGGELIALINATFENCTYIGEIDNYAQGLEENSLRSGGTPRLTLTGVWMGGWFVDVQSVVGIDNAMNAPLYEAGAGFVMNGRFRTNGGIDLGSTASLFDFAPANFPNPSTLQLRDCIISRNGALDAEDTTTTPNITCTDLSSSWIINQGVCNTFEGGRLKITTEVLTPLTQNVFTPILGTWDADLLEHFDSPANGQLRHLGNSPREYRLEMRLNIEGGGNDDIEVRIQKFDSSVPSTVTVDSQLKTISNFQGGRDVAIFDLISVFTLDQNDYVFLEMTNRTDNTDATCEIDSFFIVEARG